MGPPQAGAGSIDGGGVIATRARDYIRRLSVAGDRAPADRAVTSGPLYLTQDTMTENSPATEMKEAAKLAASWRDEVRSA